MFDPVTICLIIIAGGIAAIVVILYQLRNHPALQARADAILSPEADARLKAIEAAMPSRVDVEAELAKVEASLAPVREAMARTETNVSDWLRAHGYTVSK